MKTEREAEGKSWPKTGKEMYIILFFGSHPFLVGGILPPFSFWDTVLLLIHYFKNPKQNTVKYFSSKTLEVKIFYDLKTRIV